MVASDFIPVVGPRGDAFILVLVCCVAIVLGLYGVYHNHNQKRRGQIYAWLGWTSISSLDLALLIGPIGVWEAEPVVAWTMRIVWLWISVNWTFARTGYSWSIYPSASGGSARS